MATSTKDPPPPSANVPVPDLSDQGYAQSFGAKVPLPAAQPSPLPEPPTQPESEPKWKQGTPIDQPAQSTEQSDTSQPKWKQGKPIDQPPPTAASQLPKWTQGKPIDQPQGPAQPPAAVVPATTQPPPNQPPQSQLPSQFQTPPQPAPQLTIPTPTPESAEPDPHELQQTLIAQGKSPGEAQALANGQQPKTLAGKAPTPKQPPVVTAPVTVAPIPSASDEAIRAQNEQALAQPPPVAKLPTPVDTLQAGKNNAVDPVQLYSYLLGKFSHSPLVNYVPPDGAQWGIKTGSAAEWAAFGLAVAKQESDLNTRSYNDADPGGSAGLFQFGQGQTQFTGGRDQFDAQASADAFVRSVEHYLANKGSVANMGDTFGSIRRPNEAGQYIAGAQKVAAGGSGKDLVSSGGGEKSAKTSRSGRAPVEQPQISLPGGEGSGGHPQAPSGGGYSGSGGGGGGGTQGGGRSEAGNLSFYPGGFGGGGGGGGGEEEQAAAPSPSPRYQPQQMQVSAPLPDEAQNPTVAALLNRGFSPQQAQQLAQGMQNIAPGKGIGPLNVKGPPPPAPSTPANLQLTAPPAVTPKLVSPKQLMPGKMPPIVPKKAPPPAAPAAPTQAKTPPTPPAAPTRTPAVTPAQQAPTRQPQQAQAPTPPPGPPKDQPAPEKGAITKKVQAWLGSLSGQEREAVDHFLAGRPAIQRGTDPKSAAWDSAIAKAPIHEGTVFRGLARLKDSDLASLKAGNVIHNQHDSSASADQQNAKDFSRITFINEGREPQEGHSLVMEVNGHHRAINPEGSRDIRTGVPYQKEVILPKGTDYRVKQFKENHYGPGQHHVILDQVSAPAQQQTQETTQEPTAFTGRPAGSTHGNPNPPGADAISKWPRLRQQAEQHASILSPDDPRVKRQADGKIKGEHFVPGDPFHEQLWQNVRGGPQGRQRQIVGQAEQAIADKAPMHISYISSPAEAALYPTRESRTMQYEKHSPEERLMGTTTGQLVGHSMIPVSVGITPTQKASEPHESVIHGISTNVLANNFQHINAKLTEMGRKTPYKEFGTKFTNDLEGYLSNLNAGHTGTGYGHAAGTAEYPNSPDENHVPYKLTRLEADFINAAINNTAAFAKHEDGQALRRLAEANGTLITPAGETNRLLHEIELHDPGWSGRGSGKRGRVLEPSIRSFKTGLVHDVHPTEEHMPATIRPGKQYQDLTKAVHRTSQRGRPDIPISVSPRSQPTVGIPRDLAHNARINVIEREFSEDRINETQARKLLEAIGENPAEYQFHGGSGGLISPYEDDPLSISSEEHAALKDNLRKKWISGGLDIENYKKRTAEVPLPTKPSSQDTPPKPPAAEPEEPEKPKSEPKEVSKPKTPKRQKKPKDDAMPHKLALAKDLWEKHGTEGLQKILSTPIAKGELKKEYGLDLKA